MSASARGFFRVLLVAALAVGTVGLFRLGRQFPAAAQSPGLLVPFLMPVLALTLEAASFVALSAVLLQRLGREGRASLKARAALGLPALALMGVALAGAALLPRGTEQPGLLANDLIGRALAGCSGGTTTVAVPLLGLDVKCGATPGSPALIEGPMPGVRAVRVAMRELSFSEDLRRVRIAGLELSAKRALSVHLSAGTAEIKGLAPWTRPPQMSALARLSMLASLAAVLWLAASAWWRPGVAEPESTSPPPPASRLRRALLRLRRALLLAAPGVAMAVLVITFDQQRAGVALYGVAAAAGVALLVLLGLLARHAPKLFGSFGNS